MTRKVKKAPTEKKARRNDWETPEKILTPVRTYCPDGVIGLDPATRKENPTQAKSFFTRKENGLVQPWGGRGVVWVNPPYGRFYEAWLAKIQHEARLGTEMISILPCNRFEQQYLQDLIAQANAICFVRKRVPFIIPRSKSKKKSGNPYPSMLLLFNGSIRRFHKAFHSHPALSRPGGVGLVRGFEWRCACGADAGAGTPCRCVPVHEPKPFASLDRSKCEIHGDKP